MGEYGVLTEYLLTAMRPIWSLALDCLTKLKILTKHERILISYKFFHIKFYTEVGTTKGYTADVRTFVKDE